MQKLTAQAATRSNPNDFMGGGKTLHVSLQRSLIGRGSIMLALLLSVFVNVGWGQINSEYRFIQYNVPDTYQHAAEDTVVKLTMDCLAANGYGQWTASSQTNSPTTPSSSWVSKGWFLLGNRINESHIFQPPNPPYIKTTSGVVSKGKFVNDAYPAHMKVAANLDGSVRYVWPDPDNRMTFIVQGFDDERGPNPTQRQIDISFDGFPNPPMSRQAIKNSIFQYQVPNNIPTGGNIVVTEPPLLWQDEFDVAIDKNFLYITWATPIGGGAGRDVWATAIALTNGATAAGYPKLIKVDAHRPTIACDVRSNFTTTPQFSVACIGQTIPTVQLYSVVLGNIIPKPLQQRFRDPNVANAFINFPSATHARVVVPSEPSLVSGQVGVYAIVHWSDDQLIFYNDAQTDPIANYVDGQLIAPVLPLMANSQGLPGYPILDKPIIAFANPYDGQTPQEIANKQFHVLYQYKDAKTSEVLPITLRNPLLITRNFDNGSINPGSNDYRLCLNVNSGIPEANVEEYNSPYAPVGLLSEDPDTYVGAVNQMGIHVHWRATGESPIHYYSRDINRRFDELIEENTLVTNNCWVADGTTHGGTVGAQLTSERTMTIWTDPNWGKVQNNILVADPRIEDRGKLKFVGDNVKLDVGTPNVVGLPESKLITLSDFLCIFPQEYDNQILRINPDATWEFLARAQGYIGSQNTFSEYYPSSTQTPFIYDITNFTDGGGKIVLAGKTAENVLHPAVLNIHGGTDLLINNGTIIDADKAEINSLFESSIYPTNHISASSPGYLYYNSASYLNGPELGHITIEGQAKIYNSVVNSLYQDASFTNGNYHFITPEYYHTINVKPGWTGTTGYQFDADNTTFRNISSGVWDGRNVNKGYESILFSGNTNLVNYKDIRFNGCEFISALIAVNDPVKSFSILGSDFTVDDDLYAFIWIEFLRSELLDQSNNPYKLDYKGIRLEGNNFTHSLAGAWEIVGSMMKFTGFDLHHVYTENSVQYNRILISENNFSITDNTGEVITGIHLLNSSASITHNVLSGPGTFVRGIWNHGTGLPFTPSSSFLCSNTIENCFPVSGYNTSAGIETDYWFGYAKLNEISNCHWGHIAGAKVDNAGILFSHYYDNAKAGLLLQFDAIVDLAGVHSSSTNNYEAKNTIEHNNLDNQNTATGGQVEFDANIDMSLSDLLFTSTQPLNAKNNFVRNTQAENYFYYQDNANGTYALGSINDNYWAYGSYTTSPAPSTSNALLPFLGVSYTTPALSTSNFNTPSGVSCGEPSAFIKNKGDITSQSVLLNSDECEFIYLTAGSLKQANEWQKAYDTLKYYIETCAMEPKSARAFSGFISANFLRSTDPNRYPEHLKWLKKVLYYKPDTSYYCADVSSMIETFMYFDSTHGTYIEAGIAVGKYLIDSAHCGTMREVLIREMEARIEYLYKRWKDTVTDSLKTPFKLIIPSLEELDLTILRGPQNNVSPVAHQPHLGELIATRNPFTDILELKYRLDKSAMVRIDVYDLLGRAMYSEGQGYKAEGEHVLSLQSKGWASGSYYARLSSPSGEVKTVKVVKE